MNKSKIYNVFKYKPVKNETVVKSFYIRCDDRYSTKKLCTFISIVVPYKNLVRYSDGKQQVTCKKFKNRS